jgi:hypothetical protein
MTGGTRLFDADGDTEVSVERTSDEDNIHFATAGTDRMHIRADGTIELNNLSLSDQTITGINTNGNIAITPNGTGNTVITNLQVAGSFDLGDLDALNVGDINVDSVSSDNGTDFDLTLDDNSATALEIKEGSNAYMTFVTTNSGEQITVDKKMVVSTGVTFETDTADINGGAIDGTTIGANSAAAVTSTDLTANGTIDIDSTGTGNIDNVVIGANTAAAGTFTNLTANGTIDIDSTGNMDGIIIGANTAAAGTFTTANATTVVTTNVQATNFKANDGTAAMTIADSTGDVNVSTNFSVDGNLTVNGTTTTIDSATLTVEDPLIQLAKNNSGGDANTFDQGLFFNRGSLDNVSFIWDESTDQFAFAVTASEDGTTAGNITIDSYANVRANVITGADVETGTISAADGTQSATIANSTGVMTIASAVLTTADINGGSLDGVTIGAASAAAGTFTNLTANGTIDIDSTGNMDGIIIGANTPAAGTFTSLSGTSLSVGDGNITNVGDINLDSISSDDGAGFDLLLDDNQANALEIKEGANAYVNFATTDGSELITFSKATTIATGVTFTTDTADINGGAIDGTTIGANTAAAGTFTTATATSVNATNYRANDGTAAIVITDSTGAVAVSTALTATGNVSVNGGTFIFNEAGADLDFRFEGDNNANLLFGDAGNDRIGILTASPGYTLDVGTATDAIALPAGNTAARPTPVPGVIRFNNQTGKYEGSQDGSTWVDFATSGDAPTFTKETATGDGSTTTFAGFFSTEPESANNVFVYIDNVYQEPTENYSVSGTNITFTSAPHSGARIFAITGADNSALVTGGVARSEGTATEVSGSSAVTVFSFNAATYRSAEIYIQITDAGNTEYSAMKGIVIHDGSTAYGTIFGVTNTGSNDLAEFSFIHDGSNTVSVQATPNNSGTQSIKVQYSLAS